MSSGLVCLFWNWKALKWQTNEDFAVNGGTTLGVQWFFTPPFVSASGKGFVHDRVMKFEYEMLEVMTPDGTGYSKETIWVGSKIDPPAVELQTDTPSQMPFVEIQDATETKTTRAWFIPTHNPRYARGADSTEEPPIS